MKITNPETGEEAVVLDLGDHDPDREEPVVRDMSTPPDEPPTVRCEACWGEGRIHDAECLLCHGTGEVRADAPRTPGELAETIRNGISTTMLMSGPVQRAYVSVGTARAAAEALDRLANIDTQFAALRAALDHQA